MLTLRRRNNLSNLDRVFDDFFGTTNLRNYYRQNFSPDIDIRETKDKVIVEAELPGLEREEVKVNYENGSLKISGEKKTETTQEEAKVYVAERGYGTFQRVIPLNEDYIDAGKIEAQFKNGILTIEIAKSEQKKEKLIEVKVK